MSTVIKNENPWDIKSIYELQFFNCPSCVYKNHSKQEFIIHAYEVHPNIINYLNYIQDDSLSDINCPWTVTNSSNIKKELIEYDEYHPLETSEYCELDIEDAKENIIEFETESMDHDNNVKPDPRDISKFCKIKLKSEDEIFEKKIVSHNCDECDKTFCSVGTLNRHNIKVHEKIKRKCKICHKVFAESSKHESNVSKVCDLLKEHIKTVHEANKIFKCDACNKIFGSKQKLQRHNLNVHEGVKNEKCDLCGKTFSRPDNLKNHIRAVHEGIKNHKCTMCDKAFSQAIQLQVKSV